VVMYLLAYVPVLTAGRLPKDNVFASFLIAMVLLVLLLALGGTSFRFVKRHMKARDWKKLQRRAYLFYALVYVHLCLLLAPSAFQGGRQAIISLVFYIVVFVAYAILRVRRAMVDKKDSKA
ncbi:MAG: hypothetical protein IJG82_06200, partial [Atopobiaceae bacterium]|nr:hypothetical protein [Atopobiaceae bacterium]